MSGVLLSTVPSAVRSFNPNLGQLYLASSLRRNGIEVRLLDLASVYGACDVSCIEAAIDDQEPEVLGFTLLTETALYAYDLISSLGYRRDLFLVAGGPHATSEPKEVLEQGFDVVVLGEGEETIVELVQQLRSGGSISDVAGVAWLDESGQLQRSSQRTQIKDIDLLSSPLDVIDLIDKERYVATGMPLLPPIITSRGCPGRCTFCSNNVSGKEYRFHSPERVIDEVRAWQEGEGATSVFFQDTAFTAHKKRTLELCRQLEDLPSPLSWICKSRCDQLDRELALAMVEGGCSSVFFGVESGSDEVLERVGKGQSVHDVEKAVEIAFEAGLNVYVHFMVGFPGETVEELEDTCVLMERLAPFVKGYPTGGILLPYPGTTIYQSQHEQLSCTKWWLDRERIECINVAKRGPGEATPTSVDDVIALHAAIENAFLEAEVLSYSPDVKAAIKQCLSVRRDLNRQLMEKLA